MRGWRPRGFVVPAERRANLKSNLRSQGNARTEVTRATTDTLAPPRLAGIGPRGGLTGVDSGQLRARIEELQQTRLEQIDSNNSDEFQLESPKDIVRPAYSENEFHDAVEGSDEELTRIG